MKFRLHSINQFVTSKLFFIGHAPGTTETDLVDFKTLMESLKSLQIPNKNTEEPLSVNIEMKRLLNEIMSPPYNVVNYEVLPVKDGIGDIPREEVLESPQRIQDDEQEGVDKNKTVPYTQRVYVFNLKFNN